MVNFIKLVENILEEQGKTKQDLFENNVPSCVARKIYVVGIFVCWFNVCVDSLFGNNLSS